MDWPLMPVVSELESKEYPIADTLCDEHVAAVAESVKVEPTCAPFVGWLMTTPASAGNARLAKSGAMDKARRFFMMSLCGCRLVRHRPL